MHILTHISTQCWHSFSRDPPLSPLPPPPPTSSSSSSPLLPSWSLIPPSLPAHTHTHTHTQYCLVEIRSPARRPHTWACLRRKRALGGLRSMRLSTGSTKSGQLCSWPGLALWGLCSWERHVSQKRREKKGREGRRGGRTQRREKERKKGFRLFRAHYTFIPELS